jgi:hypothetical protein
MRFRMFDINEPLPFSQGYAVRWIVSQVSGTLIEVGEADENPGLPGTLLYLRFKYSAGVVHACESVWHDDGCYVECIYKRENLTGSWKKKVDDDNWVDCDFIIERQNCQVML